MSDVNKADKAAHDYLTQYGATPICIIQTEDGACTFQLKFDPGAISIHWLRDEQAKALLKQARHDAGKAADAGTAEAALQGAARDQRITLTSHSVAMGRAGDAIKKLDGIFEAMRRNGQLSEFHRQYKLRRTAATASGHGFMSFSTATARLRAALVPMLNSGQKPAVVGLFETIFR